VRKNRPHRARKLVGARLKAIRQRRGLSQEALAHEANLKRAFVSGVERGVFNISIDALGRLADVLHVPLREFFDFN
jgi:transcriptional regulator with XRE-family HTH domain